MMLANRIRRALDRSAAALAVSQVYRPIPESVPDLPLWMQGNPFGLNADEMQFGDAFEQIPIVHAIVRLIQNDCANLPRHFYSGKREVKRQFGNMVDVWESGNDRDTGQQFRLSLFGDLQLYGNAFIYLERGRGRRPPAPPYAIWTLNPAKVQIIPGPNRTVAEYLWTGAGEPQSIPPWAIIHVRGYSAKDELLGTSWIEASKADWMAQWHALRIMQAFFARGGISPGTWSPDYSGGNSGAKLKEHEIRKIQDQYASRFQNFDRLWRPVIMDGMKKVESGQTIGDLRLDDMVNLINANLCRASGTPPWMLGIKEAGSLDQGKSSETSSENYWRSTVGNPCGLVDAVFSERFCPLFPGGDGVVMETDYDEVPALQQARLEMMIGATTAAGSPVVTVNEAREWWGDDPAPEEEFDTIGGPANLQREQQAANEARRIAQQPDNPRTGEEPAAAGAAEAASQRTSGGVRLSAASRRQQAERIRKRQERRLHREEKRLATVWESIRDEQLRFALAVLHPKKMDVNDPNAEAMYMGVTPDSEAKLTQIIKDAMEAAALAAADEIGFDVAIEDYLATVASYVQKRTTTMIGLVEQADRDALRQAVAKAVRENADVTAAVRDFFDDRRANAMTIARTEVAGPYNRAQFDTWKAAGVERKWWLTMGDDAVRIAHQDAGARYSNEKSIGLHDPFVLTDSHGRSHSCTVPGETGIAELDINCRCLAMADLEHFESAIAVKKAAPEPKWVNRVFNRNWAGHIFANGNGAHS
jgi:portal protein